ncbi:MAG: zinc finger domain-containing protein [Candidatus Hydrothermarchaeota archaeon]
MPEYESCTTCGEYLLPHESYTIFPCPNCGEVEIKRCHNCRRLSNVYKCSNCGFEGP